MTTLDEIRTRTKSREYSRLRTLNTGRTPADPAIVNAARDAKTLMLIVDAIQARFTSIAEQYHATADRLMREATHPPADLPRADRLERHKDAQRYASYATLSTSMAATIPGIIDEILNPKEDAPNV